MTPLRKFFYFIAGFLTLVTLLQLPFAFAVSSVFGSPHNIDTALQQGGVYNNFIPLALDQTSKNTTDDSTKKLLADQGVKNAITSSVQPGDIQAASQSVITGFYAWLEGKTDQPQFTIDLTKPLDQATTKLSAYAQQRAAGLPACTLQQLQTIDINDPLSLPCLPPGVSSVQVGQQFTQQAKQQIDLLNNPVISSEKLQKEGNTKDLQNSQLPEAYRALHNNKWFVLGLAVILVSLLIFARRNRLAGIRIAGILLLVSAGLLAIFLLLFSIGKGHVHTDTTITEVVVNTVLSLVSQLVAVIRWFAFGYAILGVSALIAVKRLMPQPEPVAVPESPVINS